MGTLRPTLRSCLGSALAGMANGPGSSQWATALPALRTFITANYNQPNPHNQTAMPSPPTITTGAGTAGAPPAPYTGLTTAYTHLAGTLTSVARMEGGGNITFSTDYRRFPVATIGTSGGNVSTTEDAITWRTTVTTNASAVAFSVLGGSATIRYRFIVNGRYVSLTGTIVSTGGRQYIVLDFGSQATRTISCESQLSQAVRGVHVLPTDTITLPAHTYRMMALGDSFSSGTAATIVSDGYVVVAQDMLGFSDSWSSGVGGTGYVATSGGTKYALPSRVSADMDRFLTFGAGNAILVAMGINDIGLAGIQAAAESSLATIRQKAPTAQIFVLGPFDVNAPAAPVANYDTCKAAIQAAIAARGGSGAGIRFIDLQGVSYTKADATHPDTAGHKTLGDYVALQIKTAIGA